MSHELLFSVTAKDCRFDYSRGTGPGGQKRNKTSSAARCTHIASGAVGRSDDTRSQHQNKRIAFRRMAESDIFRCWHKLEVARRLGTLAQIDNSVEKALRLTNLRIEVKDAEGFWIEWNLEESVP
jgi:protein subunit release factor B